MQKRIRRLPCWWFYNKFLLRDTIAFCLYATNFAHSIKFWSSQWNHETIWHPFIDYRGISIKRGKNVEVSSRDILKLWKMKRIHQINQKLALLSYPLGSSQGCLWVPRHAQCGSVRSQIFFCHPKTYNNP